MAAPKRLSPAQIINRLRKAEEVAARIQHALTAQLSGPTPGLRSDPARPKAAEPTSASWTTPPAKRRCLH